MINIGFKQKRGVDGTHHKESFERVFQNALSRVNPALFNFLLKTINNTIFRMEHSSYLIYYSNNSKYLKSVLTLLIKISGSYISRAFNFLKQSFIISKNNLVVLNGHF